MMRAIITLIIIDIVTGLTGALSRGEFKSSKMRAGGFKKVAELSIVLGARYIAQSYAEITEYIKIVYFYIMIMNTASIAENFEKLYPKNPLSKWIKQRIEKEDKNDKDKS